METIFKVTLKTSSDISKNSLAIIKSSLKLDNLSFLDEMKPGYFSVKIEQIEN